MNNPDLNIQLLEQLPPWYREILDYQEICRTEQEMFDNLALEINAVGDNFFLQTMGETAVSMWESVLGITPNLVEEDLDFRRFRVINRLSTRPPYTMAFLSRKLDELVGPGKWSVTVDYAHYTLYIESAVENKLFTEELMVIIGNIKPAHIAYISTPQVNGALNLSEETSKASVRWNYLLGSWALSNAPFRTVYNEEVIKLPTVQSIQPLLLSQTASFVSGDVARARINGSITIDTISKSVAENVLTVTYYVQEEQAAEITSAELLDKDGNPLTSTNAYVIVGNDGILMKHIIQVKEGD